MKPLACLSAVFLLLASCIYENPFHAPSERPVDSKLLGRWQSVPGDGSKPQDLLVLQHSDHEYTIQFPVTGDGSMFFRGYSVALEGRDFLQVQLIGSNEGAVEPAERKYHLLHVVREGDRLSVRTIDSETLGVPKDAKPEDLRAAFAKHADDDDLFGDELLFKRAK